MGEKVPSHGEEPLSRFKALYLGTSIYKQNSKKSDELNLNLNILQGAIAERYPINGDNYVKGIQTLLKIYPNGIQFEHSSNVDPNSTSCLMYYPIKSLIYCGAIRYVDHFSSNDLINSSNKTQFLAIDSETAQMSENIRYPPLFVAFLKSIDSKTRQKSIECHLFVLGAAKTAMRIVECCTQAFTQSKVDIDDFFKKYHACPIVCLKTSNPSAIDVKKEFNYKIYDSNGFFYGTENSPIDIWELFDKAGVSKSNTVSSSATTSTTRNHRDTGSCSLSSSRTTSDISSKSQAKPKQQPTDTSSFTLSSDSSSQIVDRKHLEQKNQQEKRIRELENLYSNMLREKSSKKDTKKLKNNKTENNLLRIEKRFDPETNQNVYVKYFAEPSDDDQQQQHYEENNKIYSNKNKSFMKRGGDFVTAGYYDDEEDDVDDASSSYEIEDVELKKYTTHHKANGQKNKCIIRQEKTPSPIIVEQYVKKKAPQVIIKEIHVQEPAPPPIKVVSKLPNSEFEKKEKDLKRCTTLNNLNSTNKTAVACPHTESSTVPCKSCSMNPISSSSTSHSTAKFKTASQISTPLANKILNKKTDFDCPAIQELKAQLRQTQLEEQRKKQQHMLFEQQQQQIQMEHVSRNYDTYSSWHNNNNNNGLYAQQVPIYQSYKDHANGGNYVPQNQPYYAGKIFRI
jgi:hypothetical protein